MPAGPVVPAICKAALAFAGEDFAGCARILEPVAAEVARIGPTVQASAMFPDSANVGFAQVIGADRIRLRVFERGVGETLACGSGACAAAVVLMQRGRLRRDAVISLPGGDLRIQWPGDDAEIVMSGPTAFVFDGEWTA